MTSLWTWFLQQNLGLIEPRTFWSNILFDIRSIIQTIAIIQANCRKTYFKHYADLPRLQRQILIMSWTICRSRSGSASAPARQRAFLTACLLTLWLWSCDPGEASMNFSDDWMRVSHICQPWQKWFSWEIPKMVPGSMQPTQSPAQCWFSWFEPGS